MEEPIQDGFEIVYYNDGKLAKKTEEIATEYPLTLTVNGEEFATIVCSPTDLRALAIGFLASEAVIRSFTDIKTIQIDEVRGFCYIELNQVLVKDPAMHSKRFIGSCCGKSRQFYFKTDVQTAKTVMTKQMIHADRCISLMKEMQAGSDHFQRTGGVHNAALCTVSELIMIKTDIGRHNALDKIYGDILERRIPVRDKVLVFSGRISSEVLLKASKMGIGIIISKSAPTDLALALANDLNITAIGFTRGNKMNIYTHPERIIEYAEQFLTASEN